jgi:hypothetical protein
MVENRACPSGRGVARCAGRGEIRGGVGRRIVLIFADYARIVVIRSVAAITSRR